MSLFKKKISDDDQALATVALDKTTEEACQHLNEIYNLDKNNESSVNTNTEDKKTTTNNIKIDTDNIKEVKKLNQPHKGEKHIGIEKGLIVDLKDVVKIFVNENVQYKVLKDVNLRINEGEFVVILGPSGSGKTTLMNIISGLERATTGVVNVLGSDLINFNNTELTTFRRENIGYIFQQYGLLPNLTVKDNILLGEYLEKKNYKFYTKNYKKQLKAVKKEYKNDENNPELVAKIEEINKQYYENINEKDNVDNSYFLIENIMKMLQIDQLEKKYPGQLSGGQQQRVSIARTLIKKPKILFADEPTGAVDTEMSKIIMNSLVEINKILGTTIVIVTHNPVIAQMADKVIHFFDGNINEVVVNKNKKTVEEIKWE